MVSTGEFLNTCRKTCPSATFPPQISYGLMWHRTRASAVRLTLIYLNIHFVQRSKHYLSGTETNEFIGLLCTEIAVF